MAQPLEAREAGLQPAASREKIAPDAPTGLSIRREFGKLVYDYAGRRIRPRPLGEIDVALREARAEKNWPEYFANLLELIVHDSPEADRRLLAIMADETLRLPGPWIGERFFEGLENSTLDGIAAAAVARAKVELAEKGASRWRGRGFLSLVARFGDAADLEWIETMEDSANRRREIYRALAQGAANPLAAQRLKQQLVERPDERGLPLREFAQANPAMAFETALEMLPRGGGRDEVYRFLGQATRAGTLDRARAALLALQDERARLFALRGVEAIGQSGLDTGAFAPLLDTPRLVIDEALAGLREDQRLGDAVRAIEYNRVAWTDRNVAALQRLANQGTGKWSQRAKRVVEKIAKTRLDSGWEPERTN